MYEKQLMCDTCSNAELSVVLLEKFVKPLLDNIAMNHTNKCERVPQLNTKPLSRKVLKLT